MDNTVNFYDHILREMGLMGFRDSTINAVKNDQKLFSIKDESQSVQKVHFNIYFNRLFAYAPELPPSRIRMALNTTNTNDGWLDDMKLVILIFLKSNEDIFFPIPN